MKFCVEDKDMLNSVLSQLRELGIQVPKVKKMKPTTSKRNKGHLQSKKVFGVCLADQGRLTSSHMPEFILLCTGHLQNYSKEMGLFRKAGSISRQKKLRVKIESGGTFEAAEPNDVASLLKQWLRELPEPLVPRYLYDSFIGCLQLNANESITATLLMCLLLPPEHLLTLKHLMVFLADLATYNAINNMNTSNLALVMSPNIFVLGKNAIDQSSNFRVKQLTAVTKILIENASKIGEIPPSLTFKFPIQESICESSCQSEGVESSPSLSRKHYLLRSIKRLVKQNGTSVSNATVTQPNGPNYLRHTLSVSNMEKASLKPIPESKGNYNFFGTRNSEDVFKRSFRLLRKNNKRGLAQTKEHLFTQSLEIESQMSYQMEVDHIKTFPTVQESSLKDKSDSGFFNFNNFGGNRPLLEDIEMTTFSTRLNEPSDNLVAFPMFSQNTLPNYFLPKLENGKDNYIQGAISNPIEKPQPKVSGMLHCSIRVPETPNDLSNGHVSLFKNLMESDSDVTECGSMSNQMNVSNNLHLLANNSFQINNKNLLGANCAESGDTYQLLRQTTFVIEPSLNTSTEYIKRPCIDEQKSKRIIRDSDIEGDGLVSSKRHCKVLNTTNSKTNTPVRRVANESVNPGRSSVRRSKTPIKQTPLQMTRNETNVKRCSSLNIQDKKKADIKARQDQTFPIHVQDERSSRHSFSKRGGQIDTPQKTLPSCLTTSKCSEIAEAVSKMSSETNLVPKRKLSFSRRPVTTSRHSDSKIPRLIPSFEISAEVSFNEVPKCTQKATKTKSIKNRGSSESITRIPIKCNDNTNLSTLELSINDSCFLTPRRNAMLSPSSVVWMSGTKYFDSKSPEVTAFNKRESIAMILKNNPGHVQSKVHLYDDLVRESVDSTTPSHSTPTTKYRNSLGSQSLKSTPKRRTNAANDKFTPKKPLVNRSSSLRNENAIKPKFIMHTEGPSPIKSLSLKDITNTSIGCKSLINDLKQENENAIKKRKKLKQNSFSGNNSKRCVRKISRSKSSPGGQRPYVKVACPIQE